VIVSKHGKSYDTSDGSEQSCQGPASPTQTDGQAAKGQWEDDGGRPDRQPPEIVRQLAWKPAWSVLSLADLNEAIRREDRGDDPARVRQESERAVRRMTQAIQAHEDRVAAAAEAEQDRYRNDWEHR
jgi:cell division septum initiation protein DivIVA